MKEAKTGKPDLLPDKTQTKILSERLASKTPTEVIPVIRKLEFELKIEPRETCPKFIDYIKQMVINTYCNKSYKLLFIQDINLDNAAISYGKEIEQGLWKIKVIADATVFQYNVGDIIEITMSISPKSNDNTIMYGIHPHFDCNIRRDNLSDLLFFNDAKEASLQFKLNNQIYKLKNNQKVLVKINDINQSSVLIGYGSFLRADVYIIENE